MLSAEDLLLVFAPHKLNHFVELRFLLAAEFSVLLKQNQLQTVFFLCELQQPTKLSNL